MGQGASDGGSGVRWRRGRRAPGDLVGPRWRNVVIYFFSGTGNTELVSRLLERALLRHQVQVTRQALDFVAHPSVEPFDAVLVGFPVHGFGVPTLVRRFIARLPTSTSISTSRRAVAFCTYGGFSCGAELWAAELLAERGLDPVGALGFRMPHNNPPGVGFAQQPVAELVRRAGEKVDQEVPRLLLGTERIAQRSLSRAAVASWLNPLALDRHLMDFSFSRRARVDPRCNGCGSCVISSPTESLSMHQGVPRFADTCASCLRCYHRCPKAAIHCDAKSLDAPRYRGPLGDFRPPLNRPLVQFGAEP